MARLILRWTIGLLIAATGITGCKPHQGPPPRQPGEKLNVVATTGMIADAANAVGGDFVKVTGLMRPGVDPHMYKPSEGDVRRLAEANVVMYNGLHLEARLGDVLERMGDRIKTVAVGDAIPADRLIEPPDGGQAHDPHIWFDVDLWGLVVGRVQETLMEAIPEHADEIRAQGEAYRAKLAELDQYTREKIATIPREKRVLISAHDAFFYFSRAYDIEVRGLQGINTAAEAGARDVDDLAAFIAGQRIPAIFVETSVPKRNIEAVIEAVRARGHEIHIGGELFSDSMGAVGTTEGTYLGMVRHNVDTITQALAGGTAH
ncbi:manganese transporter [candidate division BRC1 bacterium HGW-BRC1-1]|jgi:manganese/zinc/iron transport system substrate-binding protein|nr:MAG: manganese transporter [candidate division BRC1 bacterium HGW-BRC1-1]